MRYHKAVAYFLLPMFFLWSALHSMRRTNSIDQMARGFDFFWWSETARKMVANWVFIRARNQHDVPAMARIGDFFVKEGVPFEYVSPQQMLGIFEAMLLASQRECVESFMRLMRGVNLGGGYMVRAEALFDWFYNINNVDVEKCKLAMQAARPGLSFMDPYIKGQMAESSGNTDAAIAFYSQACQLMPGNVYEREICMSALIGLQRRKLESNHKI